MEFIIGCVIYIVICQVICNVLDIKTFSKQALVYAVVGCVGGFILKATLRPDNEDVVEGGNIGNGGYSTSLQMEGLISNYPVIMDLRIDGNEVSGSYYYKSQGSGKRLYLNGTLDGNHLELYERNADGMNTGHFDGTYQNGVYRGSFVNYKGITYNFLLSKH